MINRSVLVSLGLFALTSCATYREDLDRGQRLYDENQYEHALSIWRMLEADTDSLSLQNQARYAYLRGMTDYRLGVRPDARHWLGLARAIETDNPGVINSEWKERLTVAITDLDRDFFGAGAAATEPSGVGAVGAGGAGVGAGGATSTP